MTVKRKQNMKLDYIHAAGDTYAQYAESTQLKRGMTKRVNY